MGIFKQLSSPQFISTILLLRIVFTVLQPLNLVLQKGVVSLCLADIPVYLNKSCTSLEKLKFCKESRPHFTFKKFKKMISDVQTGILSSPPSSRLRGKNSSSFSFDEFEKNVFLPFIELFIAELKEAFQQLDFWLNVVIFDTRKLPNDLQNYGNEELNALASYYAANQSDTYKDQVSEQPADIDSSNLNYEWDSFKSLTFEKKKLYQNNIDKKIMAADNDERKALVKPHEEYTPSLLFKDLQHDRVCQKLFPCCIYLLQLSIMFSLSVSCIERLFSRMKLIKTRLRNRLSQISLDSLLRISTEKPTKFSDGEY